MFRGRKGFQFLPLLFNKKYLLKYADFGTDNVSYSYELLFEEVNVYRRESI